MMIQHLSSPTATAIANFLVLAGLLLAILRVLRSWWASFRTRWLHNSRKNQRTMALADIKQLRSLRENHILLAHHVVKSLIDELIGYFMFISAIILTALYMAAFDVKKEYGDPKYEIWEDIIRDPTYWFGHAFITYVLIFVVTVLWLFGLKYAVRDMKRTVNFEIERRKLIDQYIKLRPAV